MGVDPTRYVSSAEDSGRWVGFAFRDGDIVISTRSKHGTTWVQMICALLVFRTPDLPAPLAELSPWLDWLGAPRDEVVARLEAQDHRRFVKTHTPLDGLPIDPRVTYVVAGRHPLDAAVSLYHQGANLDRARIAELTGNPEIHPPRQPMADWVAAWVDADPSPQDELDGLPGVVHHLTDAWARRAEPNVVLVHYADLLADLDGEMTRVADVLCAAAPDPRPRRRRPLRRHAGAGRRPRPRCQRHLPGPAGLLPPGRLVPGRSPGRPRGPLRDPSRRPRPTRPHHLAPPPHVTLVARLDAD